MDFGGTTSTSELEGSDTATSVSANLSHTRLACCNVNGTVSTYAKEGAGWRRLTSWKLPDGTPVKVASEGLNLSHVAQLHRRKVYLNIRKP